MGADESGLELPAPVLSVSGSKGYSAQCQNSQSHEDTPAISERIVSRAFIFGQDSPGDVGCKKKS